MATSSRRGRLREPIRHPGIWIAFLLVSLAGVPFYLPAGTIDPIVLGVPLWILGSVLCAVLLAALISVVCLRGWSLAEDVEQAESAEEQSAREVEGR